MYKKNKVALYVYVFCFGFLLDRLTKIFALNNLVNKKVVLFDNLNLILTWNRGVSWGFFSFNSSAAFYFLTFIIFFVIFLFLLHSFCLFKKGKNIFFEILIIIGAISNLLDRFLYEGVIDFLDFYVGNWHWPTFNLADVFVVIGVIGILRRCLSNAYSRKIKKN